MSRKTAIVEEFDDDTDLPLPSHVLPNTGSRGPLLEQLSYSDPNSDDDTDTDYRRAGPASPPRFTTNKSPSGALASTVDSSIYKTFVSLCTSLLSDHQWRLHRCWRCTPVPRHLCWNSWTCIYPIYLDAKRPYGTGQRRVERAKSLWWPLSKDIADAAVRLGLGTLHEVTKSHPRDWENPGRVRVQWKKDGGPVNPAIKSSMVSHSYLTIHAHFGQRNSFLRPFASRYRRLSQRTYPNHRTT